MKNILFYIFLFITSTIASILFEEKYREFVRFLYQTLSSNSISFYGKNFHLFTSEYFFLSFGLIVVLVTIRLRKLVLKQVVTKLFIGILLFFLSVIILSYFGCRVKILECTMCDDGKLSIHYNDIHYDLIFILSLVVGTIPIFLTFRRKRKILGNEH